MVKTLQALVMACACCAVSVQAGDAPVLSEAWVRVLPPNQAQTAAYLTVANPTEAEVVIVGASASVAESVEIHVTREVEGSMRMQRLDELRVAPGSELALSPGATHLMLLGLRRMPAPGEEVNLCLQLASGAEVCTRAVARKNVNVHGFSPGAHSH
ncbi:MAG: copper chaperone PCu(A)C [Halioglobus sp.]